MARPAIESRVHFAREDLLTASEVAAILRVRRTTAMDYMRRGVIPACKIGKLWYSPKPLLDSYVEQLIADAAHGS